MNFTREQQKNAYEKLPPEVQDFIMANETTELISNYLKESGLTEDQSVLADSEILYALYRLQTLSTAMTNIEKLGNKNPGEFFKLKLNLENNIFDKIPQNTQKIDTEQNQTEPQNNIGESFEQIILNQAKAMQPARTQGEEPARPAGEVPHNLPTNEPKSANSTTSFVEPKEEKPKAIHNYVGESDPYRESLE